MGIVKIKVFAKFFIQNVCICGNFLNLFLQHFDLNSMPKFLLILELNGTFCRLSKWVRHFPQPEAALIQCSDSGQSESEMCLEDFPIFPILFSPLFFYYTSEF